MEGDEDAGADGTVDSCSPRASGHCQESQPAVPNATPGAKRLLDSAEQVQAPQSPKKTCVLNHPCSTPDSSGSLLHCSPGSPCFQGSSHFLGDSGLDSPIASPSASNCDGDVAISLDTTRCFDDSQPDDSLLELSGTEENNSPFNCAGEEIQKILADDCMESEQNLTRTSALSQSGNGESEKDESSSCTETSVTSEDASEGSEVAERPNEALSREGSLLSSECYPSLLSDSAGAEENHLQAAPITCVLFDLDIEELLTLSPIDTDYEDELLEDSCLEEARGEASEAIGRDCPEYNNADSSCVLEESSERLMSKGQQSLSEHCLGKTLFTSQDVSSFCGDHVGRSVPSSGLACDWHTDGGSSAPADGNSAPVLPVCPMLSSGPRICELYKAKESCFSRKLSSPDSTGAEQPSNSIKLDDTGLGQTSQEETTSGKRLGKVIPVPQEEESCRLGIQPNSQRGLSQLSQKNFLSGLAVTRHGPSVHLDLQQCSFVICVGDGEIQNDPKKFLKEDEQVSEPAREFPLGSKLT